MKAMASKDELRWELASVSNELNKLLKESVVHGPTQILNTRIAELREYRDQLLTRLQNG
jgi:hypothetical protein